MANFSSTHARAAGLLYLAIIVLGVWSEAFVRSALIVPGDAEATAANVLAAEGLFRLSFAADSVMAICDVALAILLFILLRPAGPTLALTATAFRLVQTAIIGMNLLSQQTALMVLSGEAGLEPEHARTLALLALEVQGHGYDLGLIFFGVNSLLMGGLLWRSSRLPRALGGMMAAAGVVYLVGSYLLFLVPNAAPAFEPLYLVPLIAETAFCLWLLVKGVAPAVVQSTPLEAHATASHTPARWTMCSRPLASPRSSACDWSIGPTARAASSSGCARTTRTRAGSPTEASSRR